MPVPEPVRANLAAGLEVPMPTLPPKYPVPATEKAAPGVVVPNPTLELVESKVSMGMAEVEVAILQALRAVAMVEVEELVKLVTPAFMVSRSAWASPRNREPRMPKVLT